MSANDLSRDVQRQQHAVETPRITALEQRLAEGYVRIEQAVQRGDDVERWEAFWIDLLHEYESLHDELVTAA